MALRRKGTHADSSLSTPSVLLKANTGADVNLMNRKTFDQLFDSKVLKSTPIWMENYGNSTVKVLECSMPFSDGRTGFIDNYST